MENFFNKFKLLTEREELNTVITNIENGVAFRGTNLWVLIFAIFVASLGLNVNSTAVIIGAMLISPLMGPIMGIGLGIGIYDVVLLRKAFQNYLMATGVALTTSTIFFLISPLSEAHSEILARTSPTVYDVLIALFGGFAGIVATSSKQKGNVIPGVAIATALMPPLCTAGYGLATFQLSYFFGAFYLYIINTVFIALATFIIVRLLQFPTKEMQNARANKIAHRIVWVVVMVTLIPSIYFGVDVVRRDRFTKNANRFVVNEAHFSNDYLLSKKIDARSRTISLVFGGKEISPEEIMQLKSELKQYNLEPATLEVKQGFAYLSESKSVEQNEQVNQLAKALSEKEQQEKGLRLKIDSMNYQVQLGARVYAELKAQYPSLKNAIIYPTPLFSDSSQTGSAFLVLLYLPSPLSRQEKTKLEGWLKIRLQQNNLKLILQR